MSHKPTSVERLLRVEKVMELLAAGTKRARIVQYCAEKWQVVERTADNYIAAAYELMADESRIRRDREMGRSLIRLNNLYMRAMTDEQYNTALAVERERIQLLGLRAPERIAFELPEGTDPLEGMSIEELWELAHGRDKGDAILERLEGAEAEVTH